jgi:hypothetical protein
LFRATKIFLDGAELLSAIEGWRVDESLKTFLLPSLDAGRHEIILTIPFQRRSEMEACYLLEDFFGFPFGRRAGIIEPVGVLAWEIGIVRVFPSIRVM